MDITVLADVLEQFLDEEAPVLVHAYFGDASGRPAFTGSHFERLAATENDVHRITPADLVAITMLSVSVPAETALWILGPGASTIQSLLRQVPNDEDLWSPKADVSDTSPAANLWRELVSQPHIGWVTAGKLLARKRPRMIPVYDDVVRTALRPPEDQFWTSLQAALRGRPSLVGRLEEVHAESRAPAEISLLRILDISIWMRNHGKRWATDEAVRSIASIG